MPIIGSDVAESCTSGDVSVDQALERLLAEIDPVAFVEAVALEDALGRVLAEPVLSPRPVPGHTNAAVDGYAVRAADLPTAAERAVLRLVGTALAGNPCSTAVGPGETVRIMTGAALPEGADTVIMQEHVRVSGSRISVDSRNRVGQNVRMAGEDLKQGEMILHTGRWLSPADLGLLASIGSIGVRVRRRVEIGVLSTGSELRSPGWPLEPGMLYDSNRVTLTAALQRMGLVVHDLGIEPDDPARLRQCLDEASRFLDAVISTGGVSVGEADFVRPVLHSLGKICFWRVAMKPGHPLAFGRIGKAAFFGLPGNPVAVLVSFYWLIRPALERLMGIAARPLIPLVQAEAATAFRKKPGRMEFHRAILQQREDGLYGVSATGDQGSGILRSMSLANGLVVLEEERGRVDPGEWVKVLPLAAVM